MKLHSKTLLLFLILFLLNTITLFAQKHADLQLSIIEPQNGETIPYGDSVFVKISVKNFGPDTLFANQDTFYYTTSVIPIASSNWADLNPGDSAIYTVLYKLNDDHKEDISENICIYFLPYSLSYVDTNAANDSSCVSYMLQGSDNTGITKKPKNNSNSFDIFPNPASQKTTLYLNFQHEQLITVSIYDILGRPILQKKFDYLPHNKALQLNISKLHSGLYWIKLETGNKNRYWVKKLSIY